MENKTSEPIVLMNEEIDRIKSKITSMVTKDLRPNGTLSNECLDNVLRCVCELRGYLYCCADLGYVESREKVDERIDMIADECVQFIWTNRIITSEIKH